MRKVGLLSGGREKLQHCIKLVNPFPFHASLERGAPAADVVRAPSISAFDCPTYWSA